MPAAPGQLSRWVKFQNGLEYHLLKTAIFLFRLIPVDTASAIMGWFWRHLAPFNARHKRALENLELAMPDLSAAERERITRNMWENLGRVAAETFHIDRLLKQSNRYTAVADDVTSDVLKGNQACIFVSMHSGNWELCVQPAVEAGVTITGVYQALRNPKADEVLREMRQDLYRGGLLSKGHKTARMLLSTLKTGGVVAIMGDLRETRGIAVEFFGRTAYANPVPASMARACNVPIVLGRVVRTKGVHFRIEGKAIPVRVTDDRQADILATTANMHAVFEEWIREHPDQWMWIHKKWAAPKSRAKAKQTRKGGLART
ncbi:lauroyl acyltransferase [Roseibium denhamense]|nr:lauroyl acyltransferase [Roseibium denhamense]